MTNAVGLHTFGGPAPGTLDVAHFGVNPRDQLEVARRVEVSRSGTRLPARRLTPERLREAVKAAMAMTEGAGRVAAGYAAAGGASAAADAIEARLLHLQSPRTGKTA